MATKPKNTNAKQDDNIDEKIKSILNILYGQNDDDIIDILKSIDNLDNELIHFGILINLTSRNEAVLNSSFHNLVRLGSTHPDILKIAINSPLLPIRAGIINVLYKIKNSIAIKCLIKLITDYDNNISKKASDIILKIIDDYNKLSDLDKTKQKSMFEFEIINPLAELLNSNKRGQLQKIIHLLIKTGSKGIKSIVQKIDNSTEKIKDILFQILLNIPEKSKIDVIFYFLANNLSKYNIKIIEIIQTIHNVTNIDRLLIKCSTLKKINSRIKESIYKIAFDNQVISKYISRLSSKSPQERQNSIKVLAVFPAQFIIKTLLNMLNDSDPVVRQETAMSFQNFDAIDTVKYLVPVLDDPEQDVVVAAVDSLSRKYNKKVILKFSNLLSSRKKKVIIAVILGLTRLTREDYKLNFDKINIKLKKMGAVVFTDISDVIKNQIIELWFKHFDDSSKARIMDYFIQIESTSKIKLIVKSILLLEDKKQLIYLLDFLFHTGGLDFVTSLLDCYGEPESKLPDIITKIMQLDDFKKCLDYLIPFLEYVDIRLRVNAAVILYKAGYTEVLNIIYEHLFDITKEKQISALWILSVIGDANAAPKIKKLLSETKNEEVNRTAYRTLNKINNRISG